MSSEQEEQVYRLIKRKRKQLNLTQKDLVTPKYPLTYVRAVELGEQPPSLEFLAYIAHRLDLTVPALPAAESLKINTIKALRRTQERYFYNAKIAVEIRHYAEAQKHLEEINLKYLPAKFLAVYHNLYGRMLIERGQYSAGRGELEKALKIYHRKPKAEPISTWHIHNAMAISYYGEKNYSEAEKYHLECCDAILSGEITDPHLIAEVYYNLGNDYLGLNNFDQTEITVKSLGEADTLAGIYWGMALLIYNQDKSQGKEETEKAKMAAYYYTKSLLLYQDLHNSSATLTVKGLLGLVLTKTKEYDQAEVVLTSAVTLAQTQKDWQTLCLIYANLAELYRVTGRLDLGEEIIQKSLAVAKEINKPELIGQTLAQLGRVKISAGKEEEGLSLFAEAAALLEKIKALTLLQTLHEDWIAALKQRGDFEAAFNLYEQLNTGYLTIND